MPASELAEGEARASTPNEVALFQVHIWARLGSLSLISATRGKGETLLQPPGKTL